MTVKKNKTEHHSFSEEVSEIITTVPSWILRYGITLILLVIASVILLSALIQYPEIVQTSLKINSLNAPKSILIKQSGKIVSLLIKDGQSVKTDQNLAFLESTANHQDVITLDKRLKKIRETYIGNSEITFSIPQNLVLGEMQSVFQNFYQDYIQYQSAQYLGIYTKRLAYLKKDLSNISEMKARIIAQQKTQSLEYMNNETEYLAYKKLYNNKVISKIEFNSQENKYLSSKYPLQQTEISLLNNKTEYGAKEQEVMNITQAIIDEKAKFLQSLNQCITECDTWISKYVVKAPIAGKLNFAGIIQVNQNLTTNQEIFLVDPGNAVFFGEIQIPQYNMGKVRLGERVLVKLQSYPFEQYGALTGKLNYISDVAYKDSVFIGKVKLRTDLEVKRKNKIILKNGMSGSAEIITEESSLLQRFVRNLLKNVNTSSDN